MNMKNTIRCCISCILPCGALDVIRIVHSNGHVEEISGRSIRASEIMKANPKHVLKKPSSVSTDDGVVHKIVIVPPDAELQRGKIYFLIPVPASSTPEKSNRLRRKKRDRSSAGSAHTRRSNNEFVSSGANNDFVMSEQYLSEIMSEKISTQKDRRRGRVGVWRPHLESICETSNDVI